MKWMIDVDNLNKNFFLHTQGEAKIPVFRDFRLKLKHDESVALVGPSGVGKSTLLRLLYGNYKIGSGKILVRHNGDVLNMAGADPHMILHIRKWTMGYVSQFLRVIPRVPAIQVVMEPLKVRGVSEKEARPRAEVLLTRLRIPKRLWSLSPTTFSGGEQQRINIARGFIATYPVMLLDEPTASLDPVNSRTVVEIIKEALSQGTSVIGIFHDEDIRNSLASRRVEIQPINNHNCSK
ncbi:MAG: phosphonate C-P lyase system protein PhnL [Proteobacteria bacterium]|jgi:alpha-D-ribose 1-methylphosphonate 5-triphosphate synthase subunit PhnL|nr:phosphonate C-P lyase system protein PhnL [Pseudomonadota bacterium]